MPDSFYERFRLTRPELNRPGYQIVDVLINTPKPSQGQEDCITLTPFTCLTMPAGVLGKPILPEHLIGAIQSLSCSTGP